PTAPARPPRAARRDTAWTARRSRWSDSAGSLRPLRRGVRFEDGRGDRADEQPAVVRDQDGEEVGGVQLPAAEPASDLLAGAEQRVEVAGDVAFEQAF